MGVMADLALIISKIQSALAFIPKAWYIFVWIWQGVKWFFDKINIFRRTVKEVADTVEQVADTIKDVTAPKVTLIGKIKNILTPKAKLTYWLADEEVIVYVSKFQQKDKFKLVYTEIETGRQVMVNSAQPINYRLEELKAGDTIAATEVQQNQRY